MLAAYYGLRREEIIGLKWRNIDFEKKTITICHTIVSTTIDHTHLDKSANVVTGNVVSNLLKL